MQQQTYYSVLTRSVLVFYLIILLWLVLFKFSYDIASVVQLHQTTSFNMIPFLGNNPREMLDNLLVFVPFGMLLGMNVRRMELLEKLVYIGVFSLAVEAIQFMLAIGAADITDVIMNTAGGLLGLVSYDFAAKYIERKKLDWFIAVVIMCLLIVVILLRTFVFQVRY